MHNIGNKNNIKIYLYSVDIISIKIVRMIT